MFCSNCGYKLDKSESSNGSSSNGYSGQGFSGNGENESSRAVGNSHGFSNGDDLFNKVKNFFTDSNGNIKFLKCCLALFIILFVVLLIASSLNISDDESMISNLDISDYDLDGDGVVSFSEVKNLGNLTTNAEIISIFDYADSNNNQVLAGQELDTFFKRLQSKEKEHQDALKRAEEKAKREKEEKLKNQSYSSSKSSSKSSSSDSFESPYDDSGSCPYCGSYAVYQDGNAIKCQNCGKTLSYEEATFNYFEGYDLNLASYYYSNGLALR